MRNRNLLHLLAVAWLAGSAPSFLKAQDSAIVAEPNLQLFTVMAAITVAGSDAPAGSDLTSLNQAIREELANRNIPSLPALQEFYRSHRRADPAQDLSQYVSVALFLSGPPSFELELSPANLPPEVLDLKDFVPLIAGFYQEADIPALWTKYLPEMERESERYQKVLARVIQQANGYLRVDVSPYGKRRFALYFNPLGPASQVDARSYGEHYYLVVGTGAQMPEDEIRHGWLHYVLDPYAFRYPKVIAAKAELQLIAARAPALEEAFRNSFSLLLTESLIRAIQARHWTQEPEGQRRAVQEAVEEGLFLTAYFYEALGVFEQQPVGMQLYYPEMIEAISTRKELERGATIAFRSRTSAPRHQGLYASLEQMARQAEQKIARGEYEQARQILEALSQQYGPDARTLYGLGIVASQQEQPSQAKEYFTQAASLAAEPRLKAWAHIYLGRLLDLEGNREAARTEYAAALASGDSSPETQAAAQKGLEESFSAPNRSVSSEPDASQGKDSRKRIPLGKRED
ncbi:MAG: hypothetical protein HY647_08155 [Acidobacteria bacterium]|nr:hypothetical protein [Acidobacteriota bacterium]